MPKPPAENKQLSLLIIVHNFRSERIGGVECYSYNLAKEMQAKGVSVTVLYPVSNSGIQDYSFVSGIFDGLSVVKFQVPYGTIATGISSPQIDHAFKCYLAENPFDIIHFQHINFRLSMTMVDVASQAGIPVAMTLHDFWLICLITHLYTKKDNQVCNGPESIQKCLRCIIDSDTYSEELYAFIEQRRSIASSVLAMVDLLYAPSFFVAETYNRTGFGWGKIRISPLGVPKNRVIKNKSKELRFGYLGTISSLKNVVNLIRAFLRTKGLASLAIHGFGDPCSIAQIYENISDQRIQYYGGYEPERLPELFSSIDLLVVPSWTESYCLTVREALSADIPVIAANTGGIPEIVRDGVNGFLFNPADIEQLTSIMQKLIDDRNILAQLDPGKVSIPSISEDAEQLISDYLRIIARKQPAAGGDLF